MNIFFIALAIVVLIAIYVLSVYNKFVNARNKLEIHCREY